MSIEIIGIYPPDHPSSPLIVTRFDVRLAGLMTIHGCALVEKNGRRTIWGPPKPKGTPATIGVMFEKALLVELTVAANRAYEQIRSQGPAEGRAISAAVSLVQQLEQRGAA